MRRDGSVNERCGLHTTGSGSGQPSSYLSVAFDVNASANEPSERQCLQWHLVIIDSVPDVSWKIALTVICPHGTSVERDVNASRNPVAGTRIKTPQKHRSPPCTGHPSLTHFMDAHYLHQTNETKPVSHNQLHSEHSRTTSVKSQ